ncbi:MULTISPECIES: N-acetylneuraminate synthase family protein [unclassified Roseobacter]|uniref:N-acetylneuraminate synthase family protein n=1 Tax=unclassified Roseobacter TaxID=196798 RepID=UPI0030ED7568
MILDKQIFPYVVHYNDSIEYALQKINSNSRRIVFCLSDNGALLASFTDGDFRRWVLSGQDIDLSSPVHVIANRNCFFCNENDSPLHISHHFSDKVSGIPLVDSAGKISAIAWKSEGGLAFGDHLISPDSPTFIIAEIGNNHNGCINVAKRLVESAAEAGANCVKFQMRDMQCLYGDTRRVDGFDLGAEYVFDLLDRYQLSNDDIFEMLDFAAECGLVPLCTPWDLQSLKALDNYGVSGFKISSADLTNHILLEDAAKTGKPLLVSTGMSKEIEIQESAKLLQTYGASFAFLQCNSAYPAPYEDVNLLYMDRLKALSYGIVGYSGHERGYEVCIAAVARGAKIIEKHLTLDRDMEGNDHKVSLLPDEFARMCSSIRNVEAALGQSGDRVITQGERLNREVLAKSLVAAKDIKLGEKITRDKIEIFSPGKGIQPSRLKDLVNIIASREIKAGEPFFDSDISGQSVAPRDYNFDRPWGVPVRYHDILNISKLVNLDLVEFHLSYRDLDLDPSDYFSGPLDLQLIVHSPELFSGDHIMDLSSDNASYRNRSIKELKRVIDHTINLLKFFPNVNRPLIVVNAGGFSSDSFLSKQQKDVRYSRVLEALDQVAVDDVEIIIQTMPPFPWHFGGQRYHNLFMHPQEIHDFCNISGHRICLDISHAKLFCNYFNHSLHDYIAKLGPQIAHLHIVDAAGFHEEGLQIGCGEIDFSSICADLNKWAPAAPFIPEIWQGHVNTGEGFWVALDRLERHFHGPQL